MMKKIFIASLVYVCTASFSFAQSSGDGTIEKMVDVSLDALKDSYQKFFDQNRFLSSEVEGYRDHIKSLQQEQDSLESQKAKLSALLNDQEKAGAMPPEDVYRQEIEQLTDKINSTSGKAVEKVFQQKKNELDTVLEQSRKRLHAVHLEVDKNQEEPAKAAAEIVQLKARQAQLQQQVADRQSGLGLGSAKEYVRKLDQKIAQLKSRQGELEKKLSRATHNESINISGFTEESYRLRQKFVNLYDENMRLKREVFRLGILAGSSSP